MRTQKVSSSELQEPEGNKAWLVSIPHISMSDIYTYCMHQSCAAALHSGHTYSVHVNSTIFKLSCHKSSPERYMLVSSTEQSALLLLLETHETLILHYVTRNSNSRFVLNLVHGRANL